MEKTITQIAEEYIQAKTFAEEAKARQDEIGAVLKDQLEKTGEVVRVLDKTVKLQNSERISFDDAILPYLKSNGLQTYVKETVDDAGLKKAIKKSTILAKQLATYTITKQSQSIVVATIKE